MAGLATTDTLHTTAAAAAVTVTVAVAVAVTVTIGTTSTAGDTGAATRVATEAAIAPSHTIADSASTAKCSGLELRAARAGASDIATTPSEREGLGELPWQHRGRTRCWWRN